MSRIYDFSRFKEPDDAEVIIVCNCGSCDEEMYQGQEVIEWEDELFCSESCFLHWLGFSYKTL